MVVMIASGRSMLEQRAFMFFLFRIHICQIIDVTYPQTRIDSLSMIYLCFGLLFLGLYHLRDKVYEFTVLGCTWHFPPRKVHYFFYTVKLHNM